MQRESRVSRVVAVTAPFFLTVQLLACASVGTKMDATALAKIKPGTTTKTEMLEWFGSPKSQSLDTSGKLVMIWYYNEAQSYIFHVEVKQQMLSVLFDTNDVIEKYSLIDDINKAKEDPADEPKTER